MEWKRERDGYTSSQRYKQTDEINIDLWKQFLIWEKEMSINKTNTNVPSIEKKTFGFNSLNAIRNNKIINWSDYFFKGVSLRNIISNLLY